MSVLESRKSLELLISDLENKLDDNNGFKGLFPANRDRLNF